MPLTISQNAVESSSGEIVTFEDTSNWVDSGLNKASYVRTFTLTDELGDSLATLVLPTDSDTATYNVPDSVKYLWVNSVFTITGAQNYTNTSKYPLYRKVKNLYRNILKGGCCTNSDNDEALSSADILFRGADIEAISGNSAGYLNNISSAYSYLNI